ncbi:hypothetical protein SAMN00120144_0673 [Hymenobacter roseosalivarius DSM 11622]|uniref:Uncharacterized protein n=1 Tax=Hymenobacter roseosalivarius DSM 11622 TaxID=645990 RepID=A0A1W1VDA6_9BACT|nr:hypothetical protein SAMN00120144_0673 [Hymenobacter roseosalivarius DSM 11622]
MAFSRKSPVKNRKERERKSHFYFLFNSESFNERKWELVRLYGRFNSQEGEKIDFIFCKSS